MYKMTAVLTVLFLGLLTVAANAQPPRHRTMPWHMLEDQYVKLLAPPTANYDEQPILMAGLPRVKINARTAPTWAAFHKAKLGADVARYGMPMENSAEGWAAWEKSKLEMSEAPGDDVVTAAGGPVPTPSVHINIVYADMPVNYRLEYYCQWVTNADGTGLANGKAVNCIEDNRILEICDSPDKCGNVGYFPVMDYTYKDDCDDKFMKETTQFNGITLVRACVSTQGM